MPPTRAQGARNTHETSGPRVPAPPSHEVCATVYLNPRHPNGDNFLGRADDEVVHVHPHLTLWTYHWIGQHSEADGDVVLGIRRRTVVANLRVRLALGHEPLG